MLGTQWCKLIWLVGSKQVYLFKRLWTRHTVPTSHLYFSQVKPYNIRVTLAFPPDTDTPGYEEENKHKVNIVTDLINFV